MPQADIKAAHEAFGITPRPKRLTNEARQRLEAYCKSMAVFDDEDDNLVSIALRTLLDWYDADQQDDMK